MPNWLLKKAQKFTEREALRPVVHDAYRRGITKLPENPHKYIRPHQREAAQKQLDKLWSPKTKTYTPSPQSRAMGLLNRGLSSQSAAHAAKHFAKTGVLSPNQKDLERFMSPAAAQHYHPKMEKKMQRVSVGEPSNAAASTTDVAMTVSL
jgi:hypothetical protein